MITSLEHIHQTLYNAWDSSKRPIIPKVSNSYYSTCPDSFACFQLKYYFCRPNWKNAPAPDSATNIATNKSNFFTCSQPKSYCSNNTNEQLANILGCIANTLTTNQTSSPNSNSRKIKAYISNTFSNTKLDKLNNFLF